MLAVLLVATIALHVEEAVDLPPDRAFEIAKAAAQSVEAAAGGPVVIDDPAWSSCHPARQCLADIRQRTGADAILLLRAVAGRKWIRVFIEPFVSEANLPAGRVHSDRAPRLRPIEVDLEAADPTTWQATLSNVLRDLFPNRAPSSPALDSDPSVASEPRRPILVLTLLAASAASLAVGSVFALEAIGDRMELEERVLPASGYNALTESLSRDRTLATTSLVLGGALAASAFALWTLGW
ncbi:MAG: hypothetical protein HYV07_09105 [Deltaproteobacteria bacterium]|nr:hypothetical protein [Deltaproteobacteria bacterium]